MSVLPKQEVGQPAVALAGHVDDREIQHVDDFAMKPSGIATALGEQGRHRAVGALAEDLPVEQTVDDVAQGSGDDERDAEQYPETSALLRETEQHIKQGDHRDDPEDAQKRLDEATSPHHAKSHARVLDEQQLAPVAEKRDLLAKGQMGLDPDLYDLVDQQDEENNQ